MAARPQRRRLRGFTITEMMVVIGIVAVLAAVAAPHMGAMIRTQRIKTAAFDVFSSLSFARSEAIKRNTTVTINPTGGDWSKGWQIVDSNGNVLREQAGWEALTVIGPGDVRFLGTGRLATATAPIALTATNVSTTAHRCVTLDLSGRATTKEGAC